MNHRERMSSVDFAWLRMDRPTNPMLIVGVMIFDELIDFGRLRGTLADRLVRHPRFRQTVVIGTDGAWWVDDADFDLDAHLRHEILPDDGGPRELQHFLSTLLATPMDPRRPLWEFHVVEGLERGSAIVVRLHHAIADGTALIRVMLQLTDETPDAGPPSADRSAEDHSEDHHEEFWSPLLGQVAHAAQAAAHVGKDLWDQYVTLWKHPDQLVKAIRLGADILGEVKTLALLPDDSPTRLKGKPGKTKSVAWSAPLPLAEVKAVGKALGCTVNDILLSAVAGALRAYLQDQGDATDGIEIRAIVPVDLRRDGDAALGNHFGLVALTLPVGIEAPLTRVHETHRRMQALKHSHQAVLTLTLLGAAGMAPKAVQERVLDMLAGKATAVMTNVPGPNGPRYLAGSRIAEQMFWVPQSGDIGMGVSILSYDGKVQFGLITDRGLVAEPEQIVNRFAAQFEQLLWIALLEPEDAAHQPAHAERRLLAEIAAAANNEPGAVLSPKRRVPPSPPRRPAGPSRR